MQPGGKLQDYGYVSIPGDKQDNLILFNKHKWSLDPNHEPQSFGIKGKDGKTEPGDLIGAAFKQIGNPEAKDIFVFGGHLPHGGNAPSTLQEVANDIHDFEGAQESSKDWADNYQTLFMMDSNDKDKDGGNNPSYDTDGAMDWAGIHDIYYDTHDHYTPPSDYTNSAWPVEKGEKRTPSLREDIQFVSGNDKSAANTSEVIHYKENVDGTLMNPSDHLAVVNTTYFKSITSPVNENLSPHIGGFLHTIAGALNQALMEEQINHHQRGAV